LGVLIRKSVSPEGRDGDRSRETPEGVGKTTFGGFCCVENYF